jgi:hypothetical protein
MNAKFETACGRTLESCRFLYNSGLTQRINYFKQNELIGFAEQHCDENAIVINKLRECIWQLEIRAARRHGRQLPPFQIDIENLPTYAGCGHIGCEGKHREHE